MVYYEVYKLYQAWGLICFADLLLLQNNPYFLAEVINNL